MKTPAATVLVLALLVAGCGGSGHRAASSSPQKTTAAVNDAASVQTALTRAVRTALSENLRLSLYVLWHNRVPGWATRSTRGPALAALRASAAVRRRQGIQIRSLPGHYQVLSISLDPSYARAVAVVQDRRTVVPYRGGRRLGRSILGDERSRIELHRLGQSNRFVVWQVSPVR